MSQLKGDSLKPILLSSWLIPPSVVFSYWTKMLDLISQALNANNIRFERLDGKMSTPQRHKAISNFRKDPKCTVFLATVGTAGVG